jgi:polar amino acid transport system ATP-binding protein
MTQLTERAPFAVEAVGVHKWYGDVHALRGVSLSIRHGAIVAIVGPSGSGKSTLLRTFNHLEVIDAGRITVNGSALGYSDDNGTLQELPESEVARNRQQIGMVFQDFNLFGHLTVRENVMIAPRIVLKRSKEECVAVADKLIASVGLADKADVHPSMLSGGQQQRTAIARALAMSPSIMLFDEPTSALDAEMSRQVLEVIQDIAESSITSIIVTHELSFARDVATDIVFMEAGRIVEIGSPDVIFNNPTVPRTKEFIQGALD